MFAPTHILRAFAMVGHLLDGHHLLGLYVPGLHSKHNVYICTLTLPPNIASQCTCTPALTHIHIKHSAHVLQPHFHIKQCTSPTPHPHSKHCTCTPPLPHIHTITANTGHMSSNHAPHPHHHTEHSAPVLQIHFT